MSALFIDLFIRMFFVVYKGVSPLVVAKVKELVQQYHARTELSGKEKLSGVLTDLYASRGDLAAAVVVLGPGILNLLIETVKEKYYPSQGAA